MSRVRLAATAIVVVAALWWLRDPTFAPTLETGLRPWMTAADGTRSRWTTGRASFFVPREWRRIAVPLKARAFTSSALPVVVALSVDGQPVDRVTLRDEQWVVRAVDVSTLRSSRRFRRVDLRVNRVWSDQQLGVQLGEVRSSPPE
jgi:hypothetical protein